MLPLFKKLPKTPFGLILCVYMTPWSLLCALFGSLFILSRANFEITGTRNIFFLSMLVYVNIAALGALIDFGLLRLFGIRNEKRNIRVVNDYIINGHVSPNLSSKTLKEVLLSLRRMPEEIGYQTSKYVIPVILLAAFTERMVSESVINLPIILLGGLFSLILVIFFGVFIVEKLIAVPLRECREVLLKRGEEVEESSRTTFDTLKIKFNLFALIPIFLVLVILSAIWPLDFKIIGAAVIGLAMTFTISWTLSSSIYQAFSRIEDFARELPKGGKALFAVGSTDQEMINLSKSLNTAAYEIYTAKRKIEEAKTVLEVRVKARTKELEELTKGLDRQVQEKTKKLQERVEELEKFHRLTVARELKMAELKRKIKKNKGD